MCGLFGAVSNYLSAQEIENVRNLGVISYPRGVDSIGIGYVARKSGYRSNKLLFGLDKVVGDPWGYFYHKDTMKFLQDMMPIRALVGHNRQATIGKITEENAHPFQKEHIIGAHNGTIHCLKPEGDVDGTDSEALYTLVAEHGILNALKHVHGRGAYALTFLDSKQGTLNIIRNEQRTLFGMYNSTESTLYWASEIAFLDYLKARSTSGSFKNPFIFKPGVLYTVDLQKQGIKVKEEELELETVEIEVRESTTKEAFKREMPKLTDQRAQEKELDLPPSNTTSDQFNDSDDDGEDTPGFLPGTPHFRSEFSNNERLYRLHGIPHPSGTGAQRYFVDAELLDDSILFAKDIMPEGPSGKQTFPRTITLSTKENGTISYQHDSTGKRVQLRTLMYMRGDGMFVLPDTMLDIMDVGCIMSKDLVSMYDNAYWINEVEYVSEDYKDDGFIQEYMQGVGNYDEPSLGTLVYVTTAFCNQHNKKLKEMIDAQDSNENESLVSVN